MCAVQDSFKHWTAARRRIDYPIRERPVWRKATGGSGLIADVERWLPRAKVGTARGRSRSLTGSPPKPKVGNTCVFSRLRSSRKNEGGVESVEWFCLPFRRERGRNHEK